MEYSSPGVHDSCDIAPGDLAIVIDPDFGSCVRRTARECYDVYHWLPPEICRVIVDETCRVFNPEAQPRFQQLAKLQRRY